MGEAAAKRTLRAAVAAVLVAVAALASSPVAVALSVTETVNTTADGSLTENPGYCESQEPTTPVCPLRAALESAQKIIFVGAEEVVVAVPEGHFVLTKGALPIGNPNPNSCELGVLRTTCPVRLQGAGAARTVIDAEGKSGLLAPVSGAGAITVAGVTLRRGSAELGGAISTPASPEASLTVRESSLTEDKNEGDGGAITARDVPLKVLDSSFTNDSSHYGGALEAEDASVTIVRSTFAADHAILYGGAISVLQEKRPTSLTVLDSTFSGDSAERGGAIYAFKSTPIAVQYSTFAGDNASNKGGAVAGGIGSTLTLQGSILANNSAPQCDVSGGGTAIAPNIAFGSSGCALAGSLPLESDPRLGALSANGGVGDTLPLLRGSPALDAGGSSCPAANAGDGQRDERGVARPQGAGCDIGAFESAGDAAVSLAASPSTVAAGSPLALTATVADAGSDPVSGAMVSLTVPAGVAVLATPTGCATTPGSATTVTCSLGALSAGQSRSTSVTVRPTQPGTLTAGASTSIDQPDFNPADDAASIGVPIAAPPAAPPSGRGPAGAGTPPVTSLVGRRFTVDTRGYVRVRLSCSANAVGACHDALAIYGTAGSLPATLSSSASRSATTLARVHVTVYAGRTETVRFRLNAAGRSLAHAHSRFGARLALRLLGVASAAGPPRRYSITLQRAARHHHP